MSPAPSLREAGPDRTTSEASPRRRERLAGGAALLSLVLHLWALYRDHGPPNLRWFPHLDKVEHLVGFGLPCFLVLLALHLRALGRGGGVGSPLGARAVAVVVALFVLHAGVSEVVQGDFYTTRSGDPYDALADLVGTGLGLLGFLVVRRRLVAAQDEGRDPRWGQRARA